MYPTLRPAALLWETVGAMVRASSMRRDLAEDVKLRFSAVEAIRADMTGYYTSERERGLDVKS